MASPAKGFKTDFRKLLDMFFKYQRAHYHLWNIQSSPGEYKTPPEMEKTVHKLSRRCKLAQSTPSAQAQMEACARSWAKGSLETMETHYLNQIEQLVPAISQANQQDWDMAWEIATKWMQKRFKARFTPTILEWALREVTCLRKPNPTGIPPSAPTPSATSPEPPNEIPPTPPTRVRNPPSKSPKKTTPRKMASPATKGLKGTSPNPTPEEKLRKANKRLFQTPTKSTITGAKTSPEKRKKTSPVSPASPSKAPRRPSLLPKGFSQKREATSVTETQMDTSQVTPPSKKPRLHYSQEAGPSSSPCLETPCFTRHKHLGNKAQNWFLQPTRPYLILGDSNIGRLPPICHSEVQVDCFPGARIHHITRILKHKTPASPTVRALILSVGINDRNQDNRFQSKVAIQALLEAADSTFPNAHIRIATLNWSPRLPLNVRANLIRIDEAIRNTRRGIKRLPTEDFVTEEDLIHWSGTTAEKFWQHWMGLFDL